MIPSLDALKPGRAAAALVVAACGLLLAPPARAVEPNLYVAWGLWQSRLGGDGRTGAGSATDGFDWDSTLGIDTSESIPAWEVFAQSEGYKLILEKDVGDYSGTTTLDGDLRFGGATFPKGSKVDSDLEVRHRRLLFGRPLLDGKKLAFGFLVGIDNYRVKTKLETPKPGGSRIKGEEIRSKLPVVGASITFYPTQRTRIYGQVTGLTLERGGVESRSYTAHALFEYTIVGEFLAVSLGYRYCDLRSEDTTEHVRFDAKQHGKYAGLVLRF